MKIWLDDLREAPQDYYRVYLVEEAVNEIMRCEREIDYAWSQHILGYMNRDLFERYLQIFTLVEISCDNDLGEGNAEGYKLLDWLEATGRNYPIRIHSANPVARQRMQAIIQRNGWTEVK